MPVRVQLKNRVMLRILAKKNLSQNSFAKRIGISSGHISQLLSGDRNPRPTTRERILKVLNDVQKMKGDREYQFGDLFTIKG